jgi:hypothetical protein
MNLVWPGSMNKESSFKLLDDLGVSRHLTSSETSVITFRGTSTGQGNFIDTANLQSVVLDFSSGSDD